MPITVTVWTAKIIIFITLPDATDAEKDFLMAALRASTPAAAKSFNLDRLVTLEEFAELKGAYNAMRGVLDSRYPEFTRCAEALGEPEILVRMKKLAQQAK